MVIAGIDNKKNVYPFLVDNSGRQYIRLFLESDETQIFEDEEIIDTNAHNSAIGDCSYFNIITIWVENGLNQDVSVQVKGNRVNSTTGAVDIGDAFDVATVDRKARTLEPVNAGFLPYVYIEVTAAGVPTDGNLNAYLIRKPI